PPGNDQAHVILHDREGEFLGIFAKLPKEAPRGTCGPPAAARRDSLAVCVERGYSPYGRLGFRAARAAGPRLPRPIGGRVAVRRSASALWTVLLAAGLQVAGACTAAKQPQAP